MLSSSNDSDMFYYNVNMYGDGVSSSSYASYEDVRTQPLLRSPNDYLMSVIRFSIDASHIPLFVCNVIQNPNNLNDLNFTPYTVTLQYQLIKYTSNVIFIPDSRYDIVNLPMPPNPQYGQDNSTEYYYVYYYSSFIKMVNNAIESAYTQMSAANPGVFDNKPIPYFFYDPELEKIRLVVPVTDINTNLNIYQTQYDNNGLPLYVVQPLDSVIFYVNSLLYKFFDGLKAFYVNTGYNSYPNFLIAIDDLGYNYYYPPKLNPSNQILDQVPTSFLQVGIYNYTISPRFLIFTQEFNMLGAWTSLSSIVFITRTIPIQPEFIPTLTTGSSASGSSARYIITDFVSDVTKIGEQRSRFVYNPTAQYRYISLNSNLPLYKIDITMYWQDKNQNLYPLRITNGEINTVKLLFIKKSFLSSNNMILKK